MSDDNKFNYAEDPKAEIHIYDPDPVDDEIEEAIQDIPIHRDEKPIIKYLRAAVIMLFLSAGMVYLGLLWQDSYTLMAWGNAFWLAFGLQVFFGWVLFVYNRNIFSPIIYAYKSLFLMFVGKKPKVSYYEYTQNIYQNPIPRLYYLSLFISALVLLIPSLITLFILT